jgi:putative membrane protein
VPVVPASDGEIAAIVAAANRAAIEQGQVALDAGSSATVRGFAADMVSEHTRAAEALAGLLSRRSIPPMEGTLSAQIATESAQAIAVLRTRQGDAFGRQYLLEQVVLHRRLLGLLDTMLVPQANDPELKAMLQDEVRPAVAAHLLRAEQLSGGAPPQ